MSGRAVCEFLLPCRGLGLLCLHTVVNGKTFVISKLRCCPDPCRGKVLVLPDHWSLESVELVLRNLIQALLGTGFWCARLLMDLDCLGGRSSGITPKQAQSRCAGPGGTFWGTKWSLLFPRDAQSIITRLREEMKKHLVKPKIKWAVWDPGQGRQESRSYVLETLVFLRAIFYPTGDTYLKS